mgnify:CR=1 FL=1
MSARKPEPSVASDWSPPPFRPAGIRGGDMPGDVITIGESHLRRATVAFPSILSHLRKVGGAPGARTIISVYGGSGVGKSEIASLLAFYSREAGFPAYVMSGDNYPRRYPEQNDGERLARFRAAGLAALAQHNEFSDAWDDALHELWPEYLDADPGRADPGPADPGRAEGGAMSTAVTADADPAPQTTGPPAMDTYQAAGRAALEAYLGTEKEIDFALVNSILRRFKEGHKTIALKRMGRRPDDIHFRTVDFSNTRVLFLEWTHGNNPRVAGIDFAVFLYSSPEQTLAHRRERARDKGTDSHFTRLVLDIEQRLVNATADRADLILSLDGEVLGPTDVDRRGI